MPTPPSEYIPLWLRCDAADRLFLRQGGNLE
jgi:hypothetical protein